MIKVDHKHERAQFIMSVWTKTSPGFKRGRIITYCPKCGKILDTQFFESKELSWEERLQGRGRFEMLSSAIEDVIARHPDLPVIEGGEDRTGYARIKNIRDFGLSSKDIDLLLYEQ